MNKYFWSFVFTLAAMAAGAQEPQMADRMREDGKIYIVIAVIGLIFLALVFFLVYLERKVKRLEEQVNAIKKENA
jgi:hypothetical protein